MTKADYTRNTRMEDVPPLILEVGLYWENELN